MSNLAHHPATGPTLVRGQRCSPAVLPAVPGVLFVCPAIRPILTVRPCPRDTLDKVHTHVVQAALDFKADTLILDCSITCLANMANTKDRSISEALLHAGVCELCAE